MRAANVKTKKKNNKSGNIPKKKTPQKKEKSEINVVRVPRNT